VMKKLKKLAPLASAICLPLGAVMVLVISNGDFTGWVATSLLIVGYILLWGGGLLMAWGGCKEFLRWRRSSIGYQVTKDAIAAGRSLDDAIAAGRSAGGMF